MSKILVIAPHADDEILGCGASMALHASRGDEVYVWVATNASKGAPELFTDEAITEIREEALKAHAVLDVKETFFEDFPAPALATFPGYKLSLSISAKINELKPEILYLPHPGDLHEDHRAVYRASLVAARPINGSSVKKILCYETLSETEWAPMQGSEGFQPNYFQDASTFFEKKLQAMEQFRSQLKIFPHPRSLEALEALAKIRGASVGLKRAEAFEIERIIQH